MRVPPQRPTGITLLALLFLLGSGAGILSLIAIAFSGASDQIWHWLTANSIQSPALSEDSSAVFFGSWFCAYILNAVLGFGLWNMRNWARKSAGMAQIISIPPVVFLAVTLYFRVRSVWVMAVASTVLAGMVVVFWYLNRPAIRVAFEGGPVAALNSRAVETHAGEQLESRFY